MLEAAALAVSLIGLFVTPIITKSIEAALKYAKITSDTVRANLDELVKQLKAIKTTVHEAQLCFIKKGRGEEILRGLKGAIDEAEVILDLFEYESLKNKANNNNKPISSNFRPARRLEQVAKQLDTHGQRASKFLENRDNVIQDSDLSHAARETGPLPWNDSFLGYQEQHRQLKEQLQVEQNKVIAIVGHGGMGKTHLARQVYHAKESMDLFDVRMWAHVRNKSDEKHLLRALCSSAIKKSGDLYLPAVPDSDSVAALHSKLLVLLGLIPRRLSKKTCLVVIDDVWQHKEGSGIDRTLRDEAWKRVLAIFKRLQNCKVVLTTRDKVCSTTLNAQRTIVLDGISEKPMSQLVKYYIAKLPQSPEVVLPQGLAGRIAGKLQGSPLAARSIVEKLKIGGTASETQEAYMKILYELNNNHHIERLHDDHLFTLHHLPTGLQSCLAFCSMFPFEWRFQLEKLTRLWVAHGIIHDETETEVPHQDVAERCFQDLVDRSLFKKGTDGRYEIHVHIHSMLRKVFGNECLEITSNGSSSSEDIIVPATVRHLSVTASCLAQLKPAVPSSSSGDDEFRTVRTLLILRDKHGSSSDDIHIRQANSTLRKFKGVKVLDLTDTRITQLPDSVGEFRHLRCLGFPNTVEQPPADKNEITKLLLLETVYVSKSQSAAADMDLEMDLEGIAKISGIGKLEKLQGSLEFHIHKENDQKGHTMMELEKMDSLCMTLSIKGIRAVESMEEAQKAHLERKASLKVLKLDWELNQNSNADGGNGGGSSSMATAAAAVGVLVLEGLQPHANLGELHITRYPGDRLPTWLWDVDRRKALTSLYLTSCTSTELKSSVDCLKQDFPHLNIVIDDNVGSCPVPAPESSTAAGELPIPQPRVRPSFVNSHQQRSEPRPDTAQTTIKPPNRATWQAQPKTTNRPADIGDVCTALLLMFMLLLMFKVLVLILEFFR